MRYTLFFLALLSLFGCQRNDREFTLENKFLSRTVRIENGMLRTAELYNKLAEELVVFPQESSEFQLRISKGTDKEDTDRILESKDFEFVGMAGQSRDTLGFLLENKAYGLQVEVYYTIGPNTPFTRKFLHINTDGNWVLELVNVEVQAMEEAYQSYTLKQITARSMNLVTSPTGYRPDREGNVTDYKFGFGQPVYTSRSALFWGVEFPASTNYVQKGKLHCGYLLGKPLSRETTYKSYASVVGVADGPRGLDTAFYAYIDSIRARPFRLRVQYNSWFDFGQAVSYGKFSNSVEKIHDELVVKRGVDPLDAFVLDDGWQDSFSPDSDWTDQLWKVNADRFDPNFKKSLQLVGSKGSALGLWLSPGCFFGANSMVPKLEEQGFEGLGFSMSMSGPRYMDALEDRILQLTGQGIGFFKFDGIFGHLYTRAFELQGRGTARMPQLGTEGMSSTSPLLNDSRFDELKTYYLVAGTERLLRIFTKMGQIDPDIFIALTNGAYLSPWWLQYVDVVWLINADDGSVGEGRTGELIYRDGIYHDIWVKEHTKFPMNSIFNHEPKKTESGESDERFSQYLWMNLSRGTGFVELYIKTEILSPKEWDILAKALKWAKVAHPAFETVRMYGGDPRKFEVYGYAGWKNGKGYLSCHNPSDKKSIHSIHLDDLLGMEKESGSYVISSPLDLDGELLGAKVEYGDILHLELDPGEVIILDFVKESANGAASQLGR